jgi:ankyrin repeat protein
MDAAGALVRAARDGDAGAVSELLRSGVPADAADSLGRRALDAAAWHGHFDVVALLLERGAVPHAGGEGRQAIQHAAAGGHLAVMQLLLAAGAPVNPPGPGCHAPLIVATMNRQPAAVKLLLHHGASVAAVLGAGVHVAHIAVSNGDVASLAALLDGGADPDTTDNVGQRPLHRAVWGDHLAALELLLARGADVGAQDWQGGQAVHSAVLEGCAPAVELLLSHGARVDAGDARGLEELHRAMESAAGDGHAAVFEAVFRHRAALGGELGEGMRRALLAAVRLGHTEVLRVLLRHACGALAAAPHGGANVRALVRARLFDAADALLAAGAALPAPEGLEADEAAARRDFELWLREARALAGQEREEARQLLLAVAGELSRLQRAREATPSAGAHTAQQPRSLAAGRARPPLRPGAVSRHGAALGHEPCEGARRALLAAVSEGGTIGLRGLLRHASAALAAAPLGGANVRALVNVRLFGEADALLAAGAELPAPEGLGAGEAAMRRGFTLWLREARALVGPERVAARQLLLGAALAHSSLERARGAAPSAGAHTAQRPPSLAAEGRAAAPLGGANVRALVSARHFREADALLAAGADLPAPVGLGAREAAARNSFALRLREARARVGQEGEEARQLLVAAALEVSRLERAREAAPSAGAPTAQQPPALPGGRERPPLRPGARGARGWAGAALTAVRWAVVLALAAGVRSRFAK